MKKKHLKYLKNKYIIATALFALYAFFLDDNDIFIIYKKNKLLKENRAKIAFNKKELEKIKEELTAVGDLKELERIAREEKYFKKDNEDVFVVVQE
ncbi:MAG: septum formation initiator family protein [Crocinitomicaceae bacterium]|nr:septum formation initiator family protein [Crocinitomicaceae bacterium]